MADRRPAPWPTASRAAAPFRAHHRASLWARPIGIKEARYRSPSSDAVPRRRGAGDGHERHAPLLEAGGPSRETLDGQRQGARGADGDPLLAGRRLEAGELAIDGVAPQDRVKN